MTADPLLQNGALRDAVRLHLGMPIIDEVVARCVLKRAMIVDTILWHAWHRGKAIAAQHIAYSYLSVCGVGRGLTLFGTNWIVAL